MERRTHEGLDPGLCGAPRELAPGVAVVDFTATAAMRADDRGLVHGGFVFGLADHAAMLAINHPNVVLGAVDARFLRPVVVGERLTARAEVQETLGKKQVVAVEVTRGEDLVMSGEFVCFTPPEHVLEPKDGRR